MLSKYDHVRGFDLSNRYVTQECFQPLKILSVPPNRQPSKKICQPQAKKIIMLRKNLFCFGVAFKTQYTSI